MSDGITEGLDQQHFGGMEEEEEQKTAVCPASLKGICVRTCGYCVKRFLKGSNGEREV